MIEPALDALRNKDYEKAAAEFTSLLEDAPEDKRPFLLWSRLGCFVELNDTANISKDCLSILDLPNLVMEEEILPEVYSLHAGAAARLVAVNEKLGFSAKAAAYAKMFSDLQNNVGDSEKATALKKEGNDMFLRGRTSEAIKKYKDALGCNPKDESIHSNLSRCYLLLGDKAIAKDHAEKCIKFAPGWSKGWYRLGKVHLQFEAYIDAADSFKHSLDLEPNNLELKRELAEAQYLADKLGNGDPGFDARTQGIFYTIQQTSWDVMTWYKDNSENVKFMTLDEFDMIFSPHLNSFDFLIDVQNIMQSKYPQYKKWMTPIEMDNATKKKVDDILPSRTILGFLLASEPLLTAAIFIALYKRLHPQTLLSVGFSFDIDADFFRKSSDLYPLMKQHGKYAFLVSTEGDGLVIDFLAIWESIFTGKKINKKWFEGVVMEKAFLKDGWIYTVDDKDEFVECLESVYKRERLKEMIFETLKNSTISVKKSSTSDSVHTLTEETPKLHSEFSELKVQEPQILTNNDKLHLEYDKIVEEHENFMKKSDNNEKDSLFWNFSTWMLLVSFIVGSYGIYYALIV